MSILIKNALVLTGSSEILYKGDILIKDSEISMISEKIEFPADTIINADGKVALPGLINCHQHTPMVLLRSFSDDLKLMDWLEKKMLPAESRMNEEDIYWGCLLSCIEMIKSGTTTFCDMYIYMDVIASVVQETGMRAALSRGLVFFEDDGGRRLQEAQDLVSNWNGKADGRITTMLAPHAPYTCPPEKFSEVVSLAKELKVPIHTHLAETKEEYEKIIKKYGKTPTQYLYDVGLFEDNQRVILAHSVFVTEEDMKYLKGMTGGISHNPISNLKLGCGIAPITMFVKNGINVGLGTDGAGSASTLDMFQEIRLASLMQKVTAFDPTVLPAHEVIGMATKKGADVLGLDNVGILKEGNKADLILIDINQPHLIPHHNIYSLLAYCVNGSDVDTTIINGKVLMKNRKLITIDEEKVKFEVLKRVQKLTHGL